MAFFLVFSSDFAAFWTIKKVAYVRLAVSHATLVVMPEKLDVTKLLKQAMDAVNDAGIPDELKPLALDKAIDLFASAGSFVPGAIGAGQGAEAGDGGKRSSGTAGPVGADASPLEKIATRLKLDAETVSEVYDHDADGLKIVLGTAKFDQAKSAGTKQLALLFAAGTQGAGIEDWTPAKDLRDVVKDFNRFDSANFAYTITRMDDVFLFRGNSAQSRELKVNRKGFERAAALIKDLTGGGGSS